MKRHPRSPASIVARSTALSAIALTLAAAPASDDVVNPALADVATAAGSVGPGDHTATQASDGLYEVLTEMQTSGKKSKRQSLLDHVWSFDVAPGNNYVFELEAHRTSNAEGDDFAFSFSADGDSWLPLVTVSKSVDDDTAQTYVFPVDTAGPLLVRVEDTDHTPGSLVRDVLSVDRMVIVSDRTSKDTTPPPPCGDLSSHAGDAFVDLTWAASDSTDVAGYVIERAVGDSPFSPLTPTPVAGTSYTDPAVVNMTLYRYRLRTADAAGNTSSASTEVLAVPHAGDGPVFVRVASVKVSTQSVVSGWKQGRARVALTDEHGDPVAGALVTVTFGDMYYETLSATSGADGIALVLTNQAEKGKVAISGCVVDVSHPALFHLGSTDSQVCDG